MNGNTSEYAAVTSGVPQGSVLGPFLFLVFINDISNNINSCLRLFADDCLLYRIVSSDKDREALQEDLAHLTQWATDWQMQFNVRKCYSMHITSVKRTPVQHTYTMNGENLTTVKENPYSDSVTNFTLWVCETH